MAVRLKTDRILFYTVLFDRDVRHRDALQRVVRDGARPNASLGMAFRRAAVRLDGDSAWPP